MRLAFHCSVRKLTIVQLRFPELDDCLVATPDRHCFSCRSQPAQVYQARRDTTEPPLTVGVS